MPQSYHPFIRQVQLAAENFSIIQVQNSVGFTEREAIETVTVPYSYPLVTFTNGTQHYTPPSTPSL